MQAADEGMQKGELRPMITAESRLLYRTVLAERFKNYICLCGILSLDLCLLSQIKQYMKSAYVSVYTNKIEYNYPLIGCGICCCSGPKDNVKVIYFDQQIIKNAEKAGFCYPTCTHCMCFPTCCDLWGESVILHKGGLNGCCGHIELYGVKDAQKLSDYITRAKANTCNLPMTPIVGRQPSPMKSMSSMGSSNMSLTVNVNNSGIPGSGEKKAGMAV